MEVKQLNLIRLLKLQPLVVLIRPDFVNSSVQNTRANLFFKIEQLSNYGIKNVEIGWDSNPEWKNLVWEIKKKFKSVNIGVASISSRLSLESILSLDLNYSMTPYFNKEIHLEAIKNNQLLIPGISNIENFKEAINLGYRIVKIFPASKLGINFLHELKKYQKEKIFFIGAGGIKSKNLKHLLNSGFDALVIGKELQNRMPDKDLELWLKKY